MMFLVGAVPSRASARPNRTDWFMCFCIGLALKESQRFKTRTGFLLVNPQKSRCMAISCNGETPSMTL